MWLTLLCAWPRCAGSPSQVCGLPAAFSFLLLHLGGFSRPGTTSPCLAQHVHLPITASTASYATCFGAACFTCLDNPGAACFHLPAVSPSCFSLASSLLLLCFFSCFFSASASASSLLLLLPHSHSVSSNLGPKFDGFSRTKFSLTLPRIQAHKGTANSQVSISSIPSPSIFLLVHLLFLGYPRELDASLDSYPFGNCSSLWIPCMRLDPWPGPNSAQGTVAQTCLLRFHHISI